MRAMVLEAPREPLVECELARPEPAAGQVLIEVSSCGVCRTDLHIVDGELTEPKLPLVLGHQIVGRVVGAGEGANRFAEGDRIGVPWLGWTDGTCRYCRSGRENLCERARFTGYDLDGGYAERAVADERFCFPITGDQSDDPRRTVALRRIDRLTARSGWPGRVKAPRPIRLRLLGSQSSARSPSPEAGASTH